MFVLALYLLHTHYHGLIRALLVKMFHSNRTQGNVKLGVINISRFQIITFRKLLESVDDILQHE